MDEILGPETWSKTARVYDGPITTASSFAADTLLSLANDITAFDKGGHVLDLGAGTGVLTTRVLQRWPNIRVTAADIAPGMLEAIQRAGISCQTVLLDAAKDFRSQSLETTDFDFVMSTFLHMFVVPVQRAVEETFKVLRPGGIVGIAVWTESTIFEAWDEACGNLDHKYEPFIPPSGLFEWRSTDAMAAALASAGFIDIKTEAALIALPFDSAEHWVDYFLNSGNQSFAPALAAWKGHRADVRGEFINVTREKYNNGQIPMKAAFAVARKP